MLCQKRGYSLQTVARKVPDQSLAVEADDEPAKIWDPFLGLTIQQ